MSVASVTSITPITQPRVSSSGTAAGANEFGQALGTSLGHSEKARSSGQQRQTDDITTGSTASMADNSRALVGDVFGALGASTPTLAEAQKAVAAYQANG